jgi:hypothetical protein
MSNNGVFYGYYTYYALYYISANSLQSVYSRDQEGKCLQDWGGLIVDGQKTTVLNFGDRVLIRDHTPVVHYGSVVVRNEPGWFT